MDTVHVVFDVNIFVGAVADRNAPPLPDQLESPTRNACVTALGAVLVGTRSGEFPCALFISRHILVNIIRVLKRELGWRDEDIGEYLALVRELVRASGGQEIEPTTVVTDSFDDHEDNKILSLAWDAKARLLVSNDGGLALLSPWRGIPIIGAKEFVDRVRELKRRKNG